MSLDEILKGSGLDRYDRTARLYPAFLCMLPIIATTIIWFPPVWTMLGGLSSIVIASGVVFLLAQVVRYQGRQVEKQLGERVGKAKTARLLSHLNSDLGKDSRARYHAFLRKKGLHIPTREQEEVDPTSARDAYRSAVDWLVKYTRPDASKSGLLSENIAYGFRRNMLGIKKASITFLLIAIGVNAYMIFHSLDQERKTAAEIVELASVTAFAVWLIVITPDFVEDASSAYATRFLEQCESRTAGKPT